jgi:hypothetical protein
MQWAPVLVSAQPGGESEERFIIAAREEHWDDPQQRLPSAQSIGLVLGLIHTPGERLRPTWRAHS